MKNSTHVALDIGAESGRAIAANWDGRRLALEEIHRFPNGPIAVADSLRWDLPHLGHEIEHGLGLAAARFGDRIASVGVDTWGLDYVLMSRSDEVLGWPHCYRDPRTRGRVQELCDRVPRAEVFAATGCQFLEINTLCQWLAHTAQSPEVFAAAERFLLLPDWLNWSLCGSHVVEFTNATTTQFLNPHRRDWARELLTRLQLPTHLLPSVVPPGTRLDLLRSSVRRRTGMREVPVIAPATHDTGSAVAAVPTEHTGRSDWAYISSGTWSLVGIESAVPHLSAAALAANVTNEGGVEGTWRVLKNVTGLWLVQRCRQRFSERGGPTDYAQLAALAAAIPGAGAWVDPDDPAFFNPPDMPAAIAQYCRQNSQPIPACEGALVRCVLESLALKYHVVLTELETLTGQRIEVIHIVGGGSRNSLLNQLTANATGRPVIAGPVEATALGNALLQLRSLGELSSLTELRAAAAASETLGRFDPAPDPTGYWTAARQHYAHLLAAPPPPAATTP